MNQARNKAGVKFKIGSVVNYRGGIAVGKCIGIIEKFYDDYEEIPVAACVRVTVLPDSWPYEKNVFAPCLDDLELIIE